MFGVSFSELGLIFLIALVVLGPAKLPGLVRKVGRWVGKARSMARDFQQQLETEINLEELNRITETQSKAARAEPHAPPSGVSTDSGADQAAAESKPAEPGPDKLASSGYPYGVPDQAEGAPQPDDDTYSHAHAAGEAPAADEPAPAAPEEKKDNSGA